MTAPLRSLRDFRLLWLSGLAAALAGQMSAIALPLLVLRSTGSPAAAGAVGTMSVAALVVSMLPGGVLADRTERRRVMIMCDGAAAVTAAGLGLAVLLGSAPLLLVMLVAATSAILASLYGPAALGLLRSIVPEDQLGLAAARLQARSAAARLAGPLAGGALFAVDPALPFFVQAAGLLCSGLLLVLIRTRSGARTAAAKLSRTELTAGFRFLWQRPYLRTVLLTFGLGMNAGFGALMFVALAVSSGNGESGVGAGTVVSLIAVGSLAGALIAPRFRLEHRPRLPIAVACWLCTLVTAVLVVHHSTLAMGLLVAASLAAAAVGSIGFLTSLMLVTPDELVGRVQSAGGFLSSLASPLGPLLGGVLLTAWGASGTFAALASVFLVCSLVISCAPAMRRPPTASRTVPASAGPPPAAAPSPRPVRRP